jgi:hypothetical protein
MMASSDESTMAAKRTLLVGLPAFAGVAQSASVCFVLLLQRADGSLCAQSLGHVVDHRDTAWPAVEREQVRADLDLSQGPILHSMLSAGRIVQRKGARQSCAILLDVFGGPQVGAGQRQELFPGVAVQLQGGRVDGSGGLADLAHSDLADWLFSPFD